MGATRVAVSWSAAGREEIGETAHALRCSHCGREVDETWHTRSDYRVDYYVLHTGDSEFAAVRRTADEGDAEVYERLVSATDVVTCRQCYRLPVVRTRWLRWYKRDPSPLGAMVAPSRPAGLPAGRSVP
jgi:hypothetical protein